MTGLRWYSFRWRIVILLLLVLLLPGVLYWSYLQHSLQRPVGSGPAGPSVDAHPFGHVWSTEKVVLLGLGDSVTAGYGSTSGKGYFGLLAENDDSAYPDMADKDLKLAFPNLQVINRAISCSTSVDHIEKQLPRIDEFPADVKGIVVITSGGNDLLHDYGRSAPRDGAMYGCTYEQGVEWGANYRKRLTAIVVAISDRFPGGCEIFLANIYDPTDGIGDMENALPDLPPWPDGLKCHALFNKVIAQVCDAHPNVHLVDMYSCLLGHGIHCRDRRNRYYRSSDPHYWYYDNVEDPNDRGYDAIRRLFLIRMSEVLRPTEGLPAIN